MSEGANVLHSSLLIRYLQETISATLLENLSSGFPTRSDTNQTVELLEILDLGSRGITLSM